MSMRSKIIIPSSGIVELYDDIPISLTYQIADIKDPQKRHADYSKTITVPGTDNNNRMFQMIFDIGIDRWYDPNKKVSAILMIDSSAVMKGYMRLREIKVNDKKIDYDIEITGRLADLFTVLGDSKISDLYWDDLDHTWTQANQIATWSKPIGQNYVYPFIDYGYSPNEVDYYVTDFFPALYVKEIWDRIFSWAGFQYSSSANFFNSTLFKRLIIPFNSDKLKISNSQILARRVKVSRVNTAQAFAAFTTTSQYPKVEFNDNTTSPNVDPLSQYSLITFQITVANTGRYDLYTSCHSRFNITTAVGIGDTDFYITINLFMVSPSGVTTYLATDTNKRSQLASSSPGVFNGSKNHIILQATNVLIPAGYTVAVGLNYYNTNTAWPGNPIINIGSGLEMNANPSMGITEGDTMAMSNAVPQDLKMADFVNSIIKMFNIYSEYDKDTPNKMLMDTRNDFYNTTVQDWTQKRDLSRDLEIYPMGALDARQYIFTYKEDGDFYNQLYKGEFSEIYGQRKIVVDNDFLTAVKKEELIFSPTPQDSAANYVPYTPIVSTDDRFFPKIISVDAQGNVTPKKGNYRILYYGGIKNCKPWNYATYVTPSSSGSTNYPYCGHLDDPINPTLDLNFGVPRRVYYDVTQFATYTNNNLYNTYWKQEIDEITDKNSSIVIGYFRLTPKDISIIDFRHIYRFDFQNFRLNKIYDYDPVHDGLTKCEFIKMKSGVPFVSTTGSFGSTLSGVSTPTPGKPGKRGSNSYTVIPMGNIVQGRNNIISPSAQKILVTGDENMVGENCRNITILNSSGTVISGDVSEVLVLNSSGVTVTASNTRVINNVQETTLPSGVYTPVVSLTVNLDSTPTVDTAQWMRVGSVVTVSGQVTVNPTLTATYTSFDLSVPIPSGFSKPAQCGGVAFADNVAGMGASIAADVADKVLVGWISGDTASQVMRFHFTYQIV